MQVHPDGRVELVPVLAGQAVAGEATGAWAEQNADAIEQYNRWATEREPYSQRVRRWRATQPD